MSSQRKKCGSVIIPPLQRWDVLKKPPRPKSISTPRDLENLAPGSLIITPDTPPGEDPNKLLNERLEFPFNKLSKTN
jgi:hypothetical protein